MSSNSRCYRLRVAFAAGFAASFVVSFAVGLAAS